MSSRTNKEFESIKRNFFDTAVSDVYRAIDGGCLMGAFVLTHCLIDYGAKLRFANLPNRYSHWIENYLNEFDTMYGTDVVQRIVWELRNGLVHSYGNIRLPDEMEVPVRFTANPFFSHLRYEIALQGWSFSLYYFLPQVTVGLWNTFEDLRTGGVNKRLKEIVTVIGRSESIGEKTYESMHSSLKCLDGEVIRFERIQSVLGDKLGDFIS